MVYMYLLADWNGDQQFGVDCSRDLLLILVAYLSCRLKWCLRDDQPHPTGSWGVGLPYGTIGGSKFPGMEATAVRDKEMSGKKKNC